jgi:tRNA(Ser,Leu) C12 N-acetylase TAN1
LIKKNETAVAQSTYIIPNCEGNTVLDKYIRSISAMNKRTAREYYLRLISFQEFVNNTYNAKNETETTLDNIIANIKEDSEDVYEISSDFVSYLQTKYNISALTLKQYIQYYNIQIL